MMLDRVGEDVVVGPVRRARVNGVSSRLTAARLLGLRGSEPRPDYAAAAVERPALSA